MLWAGDGISDADFFYTGHGYDITSQSFFHLQTFKAEMSKYLADFIGCNVPIPINSDHRVMGSYPAPKNPANGNLAFVVIVVQVGYQHLKRAILNGRRWHIPQDAFKERYQVFALSPGLSYGYTVSGTCVKHWEIKLVSISNQLQEEILS